ncbi:craniofacial development protein 1-like isoform X1 [Myxocyprinus asiaticus]|uniref:craniofacial development protein 1-like isoform X1 n=1 Tax=Myxocyprinus asiaticus TaxID=70543 RepID=UPI0022233662|nr:craniofacial development protein 1-like isoform X1 [Myxocyprinus asiaticus]
MNYSDYDSEDYSSDEDEDYVPSDDNLSEDDLNDCVKEDDLEGEDHDKQQSEHVKKKKKKTKGDIPMRKRKKGGLKLDEDGKGSAADQQKDEHETKGDYYIGKSRGDDEEQKKKKADDLWASFLSDVGPRPKAAAPSTGSLQTTSTVTTDKPSKPTTGSQQQEDKLKESSKITITKVFDFAGEEVRVTKEVDADSREAKSFLKEEEKAHEDKEQQSSSSEPEPILPVSSGSSVKRPAGMGSILNRIGAKKQKMSTLEKSKLDWDTFKTEEGIADELAIHNRGKEGYVERKYFLERVDQRQFELEKTVRLSNMKR